MSQRDSSTAIAPMAWAEWNKQLARLVSKLGHAGFYAQLIALIDQLVSVDNPQVWLLRVGQLPSCLYHHLSEEQLASEIDGYRNGPFQQDPLYQKSMQNPDPGVYRVTEICDGNFEQTDYYRNYYGDLDIRDEVALVLELNDHSHLNVCLFRCLGSGSFDEDEFILLQQAEPVLREMIKQHHIVLSLKEGSDGGIEESVSRAFQLFGKSILTDRERDVLGLMLQGYSTHVSAERLGIAAETLRRHRKNIYQKLDISSQSELFSLFISSLSCFEQSPDEDPLLIYLSPAKKS